MTSFHPREGADLPFFVVGYRDLAVNLLAPKGDDPAPIGTHLDGETWTTHTTRNSGFSGAEPLALAEDARGRWWIGTRTAGVEIYQAEH